MTRKKKENTSDTAAQSTQNTPAKVIKRRKKAASGKSVKQRLTDVRSVKNTKKANRIMKQNREITQRINEQNNQLLNGVEQSVATLDEKIDTYAERVSEAGIDHPEVVQAIDKAKTQVKEFRTQISEVRKNKEQLDMFQETLKMTSALIGAQAEIENAFKESRAVIPAEAMTADA